MDIQKKYNELCNPPEDADKTWYLKRGFDFERILIELLKKDDLEPRSGYKSDGEQIDGSFFLNGSVFLFEAKWHKNELPASSLYQFKGKVDGKLQGTIGIFISMSGYSKDAVDALTLGKSLNIILFGKDDIDAAIFKDIGFKKILKNKLRKAAEEGIVYYPSEIEEVTKDRSHIIEIENFAFDSISQSIVEQKGANEIYADLVIICEGDSDRRILSILCNRILNQTGSFKRIKIVVANGKYVVPKVANALYKIAGENVPILIVVDSDREREKTINLFSNTINFENWKVATPEPEIESWLGIDREKFKKIRRSLSSQTATFENLVAKIDIKNLYETNSEFKTFYDAVIKA